MLRDALAGAVRLAHPGVVVTEAEDFPAAWIAAASRPDLILCDLVMPGAEPEAGVRGVQNAAPDTPILIITGNDDDALLLRLLTMGVAGFLPKSSRGRIIESAINLILSGGRYLPPRLAELMGVQGQTSAVSAIDPTPVHLSPRQTEILQALAVGQTNKEIARRLDLSPATVKAHVAKLMRKVGVQNRIALSVHAITHNLVTAK